MENKTTETYFNNVIWFNEFFDGIYQILNSLKEDLSSKYNVEDKDSFIYYPKYNSRPVIPSYNALFLKLEYSLQIFAILNNDLLLKNSYFKNEPSFLFVIHKINEYWGSDWRGLPAIKNENVEYIDNFENIQHGKFKDKKPLPAGTEDFYCFQVLLDSFKNKDSLKEIIHNDIISKIDLIIEKMKA